MPPSKYLPKSTRDKIRWANLPGSAMALATLTAAAEHPHTTVFIVPNMVLADRLTHELLVLARNMPDAPNIMHFADWETLPYDYFSPHQDIISERMRCLYQLARGQKSLVLVSASTLMQRLTPTSYLLGRSLVLQKGDALVRDRFTEKLVLSGYSRVDTVYEHGEFAIRGSLIDIFPMGSRKAFRIELFDDEVDSLRAFDPETQRTIEQVTRIELLPGKECPTDAEAITQFKCAWFDFFDVDAKACPIFQDVSAGLSPAGIEYYLPLFFSETANFFDYLPKECMIILHEGVNDAIETFYRETQTRYQSRCGDITRPILAPKDAFQAVNEIHGAMNRYPQVNISREIAPEKPGVYVHPFSALPNLQIESKAANPLHKIDTFVAETTTPILFCAESTGRKENLKDHLKRVKLEPVDVSSIQDFLKQPVPLGIAVADIELGFSSEKPAYTLIAENQLFGEKIQQRRRRSTNTQDHEFVFRNLTELKIDAPVVHIDHGVGRYKGLQIIEHEQAEEFLVLLYANESKLYVPVSNLHLISRYSGGEDEFAPLHRLGNDKWQRAKRKAAEQVRDVAAELLEIYAKRKARKGFAYKFHKDDYQLFAESFPFEETPDQQTTIAAVRADMLSPQPMDRLICGDVGFGKTEVAMRAAFIAVQNSKQIAVLVPTTLLAQQHYDNFRDRFADWPVNIASISRFKSKKEIDEVKKDIASGKVDIVIGTHKLIQGEFKYPNLGLVIIDEEHRFGVRQKETLKSIRAEVDILTMTATPIPRTLNMSMSGIRDLSIIATPPAKRLSIKTFVRQHDPSIVKEAILREIMRGGQVYYLHNEVATIGRVAEELGELVPDARIRVGHGQMRERELELVMSDFYHKTFNILVCTTIIETGIDVPSANTIIIHRADKFGLAQLHQLRGRVGRSHHQAYAYLLTPHPKTMTKDAHKRLEAIVDAQDLGAGFTLASHDLEIRGAGELLGDEQSGQMQAVGFSLYMEMLDRAVKAMQEGKELNLQETESESIEFNIRVPALFPEVYIPDTHTRLVLYKRLASVKTEDDLDEFQVELIDRFGLLPEPTKNLVRMTQLRFRAEKLGIIQVEANRAQGRVTFAARTQVDPLTIVNMVQAQPQKFRLEGANRLKFIVDMDNPQARLDTVDHVLTTLAHAS